MAAATGHYRLGPDLGRRCLRTSRDGPAAQAGHDLTIEVARWSGELTVAGDGQPAGLVVVIDLGSLVGVGGTGGIKPLTDRDRREILTTAGKALQVDRYPQARFVATGFDPDRSQTQRARWRGAVSGTNTIRDRSEPLRLEVTDANEVAAAGRASDATGGSGAGGRRPPGAGPPRPAQQGVQPPPAV